MDSTSTKPYRRPLFNKKCRVCGDKATCFNFNGLSCETCKIFFRRNALNADKLKCRGDGSCSIDSSTRKCCAKCRLDKCFAIGMELRFMSSRNSRQKLDNRNTSDLYSILTSKDDIPDFQPESPVPNSPDPLDLSINKNQESEESKNPDKFESHLVGEVYEATQTFPDESTLNISSQEPELSYAINLLSSYKAKIVKFSTKIDSFAAITSQDQILILKEFQYEVLLIRLSFHFDSEKNGFPIPENEGQSVFLKLDQLKACKATNSLENCRNLLASLNTELDGDPIVRDLLTTQFLYKARDGTNCPEVIRYYHYQYRYLLLKYLKHKYLNIGKASRKYSTLTTLVNDHWILRDVIQQFTI